MLHLPVPFLRVQRIQAANRSRYLSTATAEAGYAADHAEILGRSLTLDGLGPATASPFFCFGHFSVS